MLGRAFWVVTVMFACLATAGRAEIVVAARTLRAQTVISANDLGLTEGQDPTALPDARAAIGMETRIAIYAGRPIRPDDLVPATMVKRNQVVPLTYSKGSLSITTEGRALARGGAGDTIRAMNVTSRATILARVNPDGTLTAFSQ